MTLCLYLKVYAVCSCNLVVLVLFSYSNEEKCLFIMKMTDKTSILRYVATELATDMVIAVGDVKFYLHKVRHVM